MSRGKRDFTEVIKVTDLEVRTILDSPDGPNLVTSDLKAREISPAGARRGSQGTSKWEKDSLHC